MTDAGFFRGTSAEQDNRFSDKQKKLLKQMRFADNLVIKIDMAKIKLDVLKPWIATRITELLGIEDDVVVEFVFNQLEAEKHPDPKMMQINLTGFLNAKNARIFMGELWTYLISAQENQNGIPAELLERKKEEIQRRMEENEKVAEVWRKYESRERRDDYNERSRRRRSRERCRSREIERTWDRPRSRDRIFRNREIDRTPERIKERCRSREKRVSPKKDYHVLNDNSENIEHHHKMSYQELSPMSGVCTVPDSESCVNNYTHIAYDVPLTNIKVKTEKIDSKQVDKTEIGISSEKATMRRLTEHISSSRKLDKQEYDRLPRTKNRSRSRSRRRTRSRSGRRSRSRHDRRSYSQTRSRSISREHAKPREHSRRELERRERERKERERQEWNRERYKRERNKDDKYCRRSLSRSIPRRSNKDDEKRDSLKDEYRKKKNRSSSSSEKLINKNQIPSVSTSSYSSNMSDEVSSSAEEVEITKTHETIAGNKDELSNADDISEHEERESLHSLREMSSKENTPIHQSSEEIQDDDEDDGEIEDEEMENTNDMLDHDNADSEVEEKVVKKCKTNRQLVESNRNDVTSDHEDGMNSNILEKNQRSSSKNSEISENEKRKKKDRKKKKKHKKHRKSKKEKQNDCIDETNGGETLEQLEQKLRLKALKSMKKAKRKGEHSESEHTP